MKQGSRVYITHFVESLNRGGLERVVIDLVRAQQDAGCRCQVVCLFELGSLAPELIELGVPVVSCNKRRGLDLRAILQARQFIRRHGTTVLHTHNAMAHYYAVLASGRLGLQCVVNTRHGMGITRAVAQRDSRRNSWRNHRLEWLYGKSMPFTDVVATVCETARQEFAQRPDVPESKVIAIPNGIRVDRFLPTSAESRKQLKDTLGLPQSCRLAGFVGRLDWAKDHATMIHAFRLVRNRLADSALVLIGDGPLKPELMKLAESEGIASRVFFLSDRSDIPELLQGLDLFVMSSVTEGYSIALLEACAAALPIVATKVGGNAEIVQDGINGILVPAREPIALADAIVTSLSNQEHALAMGQAGRNWALRHGSFKTMATRYADVYESHGKSP